MGINQRRVLILFAHPSQHRSEVNVPLFNASKDIEQVTLVDLYREYPTLRIDVEKEQQRLREHDVVVFMFPLYWYSTPAILKEWQDLVLEYGFAYGSKGTELKGKHFLCATTAGGAGHAYRSDGYNHFTLRELLHPLEQTANLTGMVYLPPFVLFASRTAAEEDRISSHIHQWQQCLDALINNRLDIEKVTRLNTLNDGFESIIGIEP